MDTKFEVPFVGPHPFEEKDRHLFFGREPEAQDLLSLVMAERLVLFYAPSGAGKSSLINTRLRPDLRQAGFALLPSGYVRGALPDHITGVDNIYVFNLILSLDQNRHKATIFTHTTLSEYLQVMLAGPGQPANNTPHVLMIDQFEEIFSTNPEHWRKREDFFEQLRQAMNEDPQLWVILAMREDYVAALDPYTRLLPGKLRTRYYMRPLSHAAALEAIEKPAELGGRPFAPGIAKRLVNNLCQIKIQGQEPVSHQGEFVEPIVLQVVCYRLWQNLKKRPSGQISGSNLEEAGDVDTALAQFYEEAIAAAIAKTPNAEIEVRTWIENQLITEAGTRGTVYQGEIHTGGLPNETVELLVKHHLARRILRAGGTWYELVHDRLIDPILKANQAWRLKQPLIQIAQAWVDSGWSPNLLLENNQLQEALASKWQVLGPVVKEFLEASQESQRVREKEAVLRREEEVRRRRQLTRTRRLATAWAVLFLIAAVATYYALKSAQFARQAEDRALRAEAIVRRTGAIASANRLALQALDILESQPQEGVLLAVKALTTTLIPYDFRVPAAEQALRQGLAEIGGRPLHGYPQDIVTVAVSPGRHLLATGGQAGTVRLWDTGTGREVSHLAGHQAKITGLTFSPNDRWLATADEAGALYLWDLTIDNPADHTIELDKQADPTTTMGFSPDSTWLAAGNSRGAILLWNISQPDQPGMPLVLAGHDDWVNLVTFSPDGRWLATSSYDGTARLWDMTKQAVEPPAILGEPERDLSSIAFSPDGRYLAAGGLSGSLWFWPVSNSGATPIILAGHEDTISALAFSPDGRWLATGGWDKTVRLWDVYDLSASPLTLPGLEETVVTLEFSPDSDRLAAGSGNFVILWNLIQPDLLTTPTILRGHSDAVLTVAFSPDGRWLISNSYDQTVRVWDVFSSMIEPQRLAQLDAGVTSLAFSADSCRLAAGSADNAIRLWNMAVPSAEPDILRQDQLAQVVAFSPEGMLLARGGPDGTVEIRDVANVSSQPLTLPGHPKGVTSLVFSPDGQQLAVGCGDNTVRVWSLTEPEAEAVRLGQDQRDLTALAFDPAGGRLATGSLHGLIQIRDVTDLTAEPITLTGREAVVTALAFSPDGHWLVSGSTDNVALLWNLSQPAAIAESAELKGHKSAITTVTFSPDGNRLATGSDDTTIRVWDVSNPDNNPVLLSKHERGITALAFSPDGRWLASSSSDGKVQLWRLRLSELITLAYQVTGHDQPVKPWSEILDEPPYQQMCSTPPGAPQLRAE